MAEAPRPADPPGSTVAAPDAARQETADPPSPCDHAAAQARFLKSVFAELTGSGVQGSVPAAPGRRRHGSAGAWQKDVTWDTVGDDSDCSNT